MCCVLGDDRFSVHLLEATQPRADAESWREIAARLEASIVVSGAIENADAVCELLKDSESLAVFVARILARLARAAPGDAEVLRFEGVRELDRGARAASFDEYGHYELHAHFRGSIPFDDLWRDWMCNARSRAMWRVEVVHGGETRARRLQRAADVHRDVLGVGRAPRDFERSLHGLVLAIRAQLASPQAIRYFLVLINTRRAFLVRRGDTGLAPFTDAYGRVAKASKRRWLRTDARARVRDVCRKFESTGCQVLELRPTLKENRRETQAALRSLVLGYLDYVETAAHPLAMGLVCSFFKQEAVNGRGRVHGGRGDGDMVEWLHRQQHLWARQAEDLVAILDEVPAIRAFVVGVDAAGRERGAPTRFLAKPYGVIQAYNERFNLFGERGRTFDVGALARRFSSNTTSEDVWRDLNQEPAYSRLGSRVRLGFTVHAGEDFVDPVTGLREVWEAVHCLGLQPGDRLGHALVLALRKHELEAWIEDHSDGQRPPERRKPAGVHALDMAWAHGRAGTSRVSDLELSRAVVDAVRDVPIHDSARRILGSNQPPARVPFFGASFYDPRTPESGSTARVVFDEEWSGRFLELRQQVEDFVVQRGIVIESCPSSNCIVAGLQKPPLQTLLRHNESLQVALATDDPGIFEAWPDQELARLEDANDRARVLRAARRASFVRRTDHV